MESHPNSNQIKEKNKSGLVSNQQAVEKNISPINEWIVSCIREGWIPRWPCGSHIPPFYQSNSIKTVWNMDVRAYNASDLIAMHYAFALKCTQLQYNVWAERSIDHPATAETAIRRKILLDLFNLTACVWKQWTEHQEYNRIQIHIIFIEAQIARKISFIWNVLTDFVNMNSNGAKCMCAYAQTLIKNPTPIISFLHIIKVSQQHCMVRLSDVLYCSNVLTPNSWQLSGYKGE